MLTRDINKSCRFFSNFHRSNKFRNFFRSLAIFFRCRFLKISRIFEKKTLLLKIALPGFFFFRKMSLLQFFLLLVHRSIDSRIFCVDKFFFRFNIFGAKNPSNKNPLSGQGTDGNETICFCFNCNVDKNAKTGFVSSFFLSRLHRRGRRRRQVVEVTATRAWRLLALADSTTARI